MLNFFHPEFYGSSASQNPMAMTSIWPTFGQNSLQNTNKKIVEQLVADLWSLIFVTCANESKTTDLYPYTILDGIDRKMFTDYCSAHWLSPEDVGIKSEPKRRRYRYFRQPAKKFLSNANNYPRARKV